MAETSATLQQLLSSSGSCKRCGDVLSVDSDDVKSHEGRHYHSSCFRCHNCGCTLSETIVQDDDVWCEPCQRKADIRAMAEKGDSGEIELTEEAKKRLEEIAAMGESLKNKGSSPFAEMEKQQQEERRRKLEQMQRAKELANDPEAQARELLRQQELAEQRQKEKEAALARRKAEEAAAAEKAARMEELHANATKTEDISDLDALKSKREAEMEAIKNKRSGGNPFKEMEKQREEERKRRFARFASGEGSDEAKQRAQEVTTKKVSANPFADMEKQKEEERAARMRRLSSG